MTHSNSLGAVPWHWDSTAPTSVVEAPTSKMKGCSGSGWWSRGENCFEFDDSLFGSRSAWHGLGLPSENRNESNECTETLAIKVGKTKELLQLFDHVRLWPGLNGMCLSVIHLKAVDIDEVPQELNGLLMKGSLLCFEVQLVLTKALEDKPGVLQMFGHGGWVDQDIIYINNHKSTRCNHGRAN